MRTKYGAVRTWSELTQRYYASKAEAKRGEELHLLQLAGGISHLEYQVKFILCDDPGWKESIRVDFIYTENGKTVLEDTKGKLMADFKAKRSWLRQLTGKEIILTK